MKESNEADREGASTSIVLERIVMLRKVLPWLPIIGMPLTVYFHIKHGDTGIENQIISGFSGVWQGAWLLIAILYICAAT